MIEAVLTSSDDERNRPCQLNVRMGENAGTVAPVGTRATLSTSPSVAPNATDGVALNRDVPENDVPESIRCVRVMPRNRTADAI